MQSGLEIDRVKREQYWALANQRRQRHAFGLAARANERRGGVGSLLADREADRFVHETFCSGPGICILTGRESDHPRPSEPLVSIDPPGVSWVSEVDGNNMCPATDMDSVPRGSGIVTDELPMRLRFIGS